MIKSRWRRDYDMTGFPATGIAFRRIRQRSSICRFPATGIDLHFLFLLEKENNCSHQFLNWWQQVSTGHLHLDGFDSLVAGDKKRERQKPLSFFGAGNRNRTGTDFTPRDFKSLVSTYSTMPASFRYRSTKFPFRQGERGQKNPWAAKCRP